MPRRRQLGSVLTKNTAACAPNVPKPEVARTTPSSSSAANSRVVGGNEPRCSASACGASPLEGFANMTAASASVSGTASVGSSARRRTGRNVSPLGSRPSGTARRSLLIIAVTAFGFQPRWFVTSPVHRGAAAKTLIVPAPMLGSRTASTSSAVSSVTNTRAGNSSEKDNKPCTPGSFTISHAGCRMALHLATNAAT
ncbi:hypothetical protein GALL_409500 [mine drainage metagenome]|uniref:Uncharacterized protein n=1 Tax=mine drainage metagenome TaxID=410659 RepID=A0A1J5Q247_9ZZZZ